MWAKRLTVLHEIGHAFAGLHDTYAENAFDADYTPACKLYADPATVNLAGNTDPRKIRWIKHPASVMCKGEYSKDVTDITEDDTSGVRCVYCNSATDRKSDAYIKNCTEEKFVKICSVMTLSGGGRSVPPPSWITVVAGHPNVAPPSDSVIAKLSAE